jgi:dCTP deaminase
MLKNDRWIRDMAAKGMIEPFAEKQVREGVISYGVSSYGYDMRISDEFKIFTPHHRETPSVKVSRNNLVNPKCKAPKPLVSTRGAGFTNVNNTIVDPKGLDTKNFIDFKGDTCIVLPHSFVLGRSVEYFRIPREVLVICLGKSTYARCGIVINVTPLEPEWEGYVTIEISNTAPLPAKIYANEGIAQLIFIEGAEICETSYADKAGKYQAQKGITLAKVK